MECAIHLSHVAEMPYWSESLYVVLDRDVLYMHRDNSLDKNDGYQWKGNAQLI